MTARKYVTIWCDAEVDDERCPEFRETAAGTNAAARSEAKRDGWVYVPSGIGAEFPSDLCPRHGAPRAGRSPDE